jgi:hypothetical protein
LELFGPIDPILAENRECLADFFHSRVVGGRALAALDAIQGGSHLQQFAANRVKLAVQGLDRCRSVEHGQPPSSPPAIAAQQEETCQGFLKNGKRAFYMP